MVAFPFSNATVVAAADGLAIDAVPLVTDHPENIYPVAGVAAIAVCAEESTVMVPEGVVVP